MRRLLLVTLAALVLAGSSTGVLAEGDPRREARLLYLEGKYAEADVLVRGAGAEVENDLDFRLQLADAALKSMKNKTGQDRRPGLEAMKRNFGHVANTDLARGVAVVGAVQAAKELAELDLLKKNTPGAVQQATWALELGERAAAVGITPDTRAALGAAYGLRASTSRRVEEANQISADFRKAAQMLDEAAAGHEKAAVWLTEAAEFRLKEAMFIHDSIPVETEKRDDEAITAAVQLAKRACEAKSAAPDTFVLHIRTLCLAREWKVPGDHGKPFMETLSPPMEGLKLEVPRGAKWKRLEPTTEWLLILERAYDTTDSGVQIMLTSYGTKSPIGAKSWASDIGEGAGVLFDRRRNGYTDVSSESPPEMFGEKKKGPQVWHFSVSGEVVNSKRRSKSSEWVWLVKDTVWDLRVLDWRRSPSVEDPDIVAFVQSAIPPGLWPPGSAPAEDPKGKKPPKKK